MKKIFIIFFLIGVLLAFLLTNKKEKEQEVNKIVEIEEQRGIFISYIDYSDKLKNKKKEEQQNIIDEMINNLSNNKFNLIILQVRPFSDAIYNSNVYPSSRMVVKNEGDNLELDILEYFIEKSHEKKIKVHAWVNPYRIRSTNDISSISKDNIYYDWLNTDKIQISNSGIYFNPASEEVLDLVLKGIEEIVKNYDVDGICYDDYFYPNKIIDLKNYEEYKNNGGTLDIDEYRRENINKLISSTYKTIKNINKNVVFGISPAGNINNNLNNEYLDIKNILSNEGYLDYVMPQIYFGFDNQTLPYDKTLEMWSGLITKDIDLYIALALYKSGKEDKYAGNGIKEWIENSDIIKKQIVISRLNNKYVGFGIFRYDFFFDNERKNINLINEIENIKTIFY